MRRLNDFAGEIRPELIVILSDINMPGMDGLTLLGEVKKRFPDLPVMMVTAYGDEERRRRASDLGASEFLTKPVDFDRLISEHGQRADNIVKSMLEHSRGVSGERREVDLNGLVEEALNLAYHGARAQDQNFNITLERDFGQGITPIELVPQDMTRVFLNLFGNGFYAATKRRRESTEPDFRPALKVTTQ